MVTGSYPPSINASTHRIGEQQRGNPAYSSRNLSSTTEIRHSSGSQIYITNSITVLDTNSSKESLQNFIRSVSKTPQGKEAIDRACTSNTDKKLLNKLIDENKACCWNFLMPVQMEQVRCLLLNVQKDLESLDTIQQATAI